LFLLCPVLYTICKSVQFLFCGLTRLLCVLCAKVLSFAT